MSDYSSIGQQTSPKPLVVGSNPSAASYFYPQPLARKKEGRDFTSTLLLTSTAQNRPGPLAMPYL